MLLRQVAASQEAGYVSTADVPQSVVDTEMAMELAKEDVQKKPEAVR
jgi:translation elongation factor EF-Ts